jgi:hypothetical protein
MGHDNIFRHRSLSFKKIKPRPRAPSLGIKPARLYASLVGAKLALLSPDFGVITKTASQSFNSLKLPQKNGRHQGLPSPSYTSNALRNPWGSLLNTGTSPAAYPATHFLENRARLGYKTRCLLHV